MDAFCQSFGELIMDGVGEFKGLEACFAWWKEPLAGEGENIPAERDPKDWKVVFLGAIEISGGLPLSPGDRGAIAGALFIPELYIGVQLSCPIHITWTHLPPLSVGLFSKTCFLHSFSPAGFRVSAYPPLPVKVFRHGIRQQFSHPKGSFLLILYPVIQCSGHSFFYFFIFCTERRTTRKSVQHVSVTKSPSSCNPGVRLQPCFHGGIFTQPVSLWRNRVG